MSKAEWADQRKELLERVQKAERLAAESQSEAAVYLESLRECYAAAEQALANKDLDLLYQITGKLTFTWMPSKTQGEQLGRYFLDAYITDARWLETAKQALKEVKAAAEQLPEEYEPNAELKKRILAAAEKGLTTHA